MYYLIASCIALLIGPLCYRFFTSKTGLNKGIDGFIFASLGGLVLIHILPELIEHGGIIVILIVLIGLWGPTLGERLFQQYSAITHNLTLVLGVTGLLLHTITDGGAMILAQHDGNAILLALGVILHRLPIGLAIWWLLRPQIGRYWSLFILAGMILMTCVGYFAGEQLLTHLNLENTVYLQAFITGSILHVVLHQPHSSSNSNDNDRGSNYQAGIGSLLGIALLCLLLIVGAHHHENHAHSNQQLTEWLLVLAPILILSYGVAVLRYRFNLWTNHRGLSQRWLSKLVSPEIPIMTFLLLGPTIAIFQLIGIILLAVLLSFIKVEPATVEQNIDGANWRTAFTDIVDNTIPWIIFSVILANLIGQPSTLLSAPLMQIIVLLACFLVLRFCHQGAVVLAFSLAYSGWSNAAIMMILLAAPIFNFAQLKPMTWQQRWGLLGLIVCYVLSIQWLIPTWEKTLIVLPQSVNVMALAILALLFATSLLRQGPRQFMRRIISVKSPPHLHHH